MWFIYTYYSHATLTLLVLLFAIYLFLENFLFFKRHYQIFLTSMKETRWNCYYVLDHKERIKEMSEGMIEELGMTKEEIIGKPLFEILNKAIRVNSFDDIETSNQNLERFYEDYKKTVKPNQFDTHTMHFQNYQGKSVLVQLVEQPLFILGRYRGRINVGEKKTDFDLLVLKENSQTQKRIRIIKIKICCDIRIIR